MPAERLQPWHRMFPGVRAAPPSGDGADHDLQRSCPHDRDQAFFRCLRWVDGCLRLPCGLSVDWPVRQGAEIHGTPTGPSTRLRR